MQVTVAIGACWLAVAGALGTQQCGNATFNNTLGYVSTHDLKMVAASDAAECCAVCKVSPGCAVWSMQHLWTKDTPCHLSPYDFLKTDNGSAGNSCGISRKPPPVPPPGPSPAPGPGLFVINTGAAGERQVFEGVQVELMADSIGSYNQGMPGDGRLVPDGSNTTLGCPHDLTPSERVRFATEVLTGTRTIRLAMGLYLRGLSADNKSIVGRWPSQMAELKQLQELSGIEGWAPEYWSPPPAWKDSKSYYRGTLASFNASFLDAFSGSALGDVKYLVEAGLRVVWWGLQNEPSFDSFPDAKNCSDRAVVRGTAATTTRGALGKLAANSYGQCHYEDCDYYHAFKACAAQIRRYDPTIRIHANSARGAQAGSSAIIAQDPEALALVDAWTTHDVSAGSSKEFGNRTRNATHGKLDFTNEMEYQPGSPYAGTAVGTVSNVNIFLNTLVFKDAPTGVMMLHAIKPTTNLESLGYGWTWWRPSGSPALPTLPDLEPNHFDYNYWNWNSVSPFIKTVPWNSRRRNVMEDTQREYQRVVAFETPKTGLGGPLHSRTPAGNLIVVLTNEQRTDAAVTNFTTTVGTTDGAPRSWLGFSFMGSANSSTFNVSLGVPIHAASFTTTLGANEIQWWYEQ